MRMAVNGIDYTPLFDKKHINEYGGKLDYNMIISRFVTVAVTRQIHQSLDMCIFNF